MNSYDVVWMDGNIKRALIAIGSHTIDEIVMKVLENSKEPVTEIKISMF